MSLAKRCRLFTLGLVLWIFVVAGSAAHFPLSELGTLHAGLSAAVAALAFLPRRALSWS